MILSNLCAKLETNWLRGWGLYGPQKFTCHLLYMRFQLWVTIEFNENSIHLNPIQARFFYCLKVQGRVFRDPLMISGSLKLAQWNFVQLKHYLMTTRIQKNQKSDLRRQNDVIIENIGKIQTSEKPNKWYIIRKVMMRHMN